MLNSNTESLRPQSRPFKRIIKHNVLKFYNARRDFLASGVSRMPGFIFRCRVFRYNCDVFIVYYNKKMNNYAFLRNFTFFAAKTCSKLNFSLKI